MSDPAAMRRICLVAVDVRSAHNIGSFFRTCDGFGAEILLVGICPRPLGDIDVRLPHIAMKADVAIAKTALGAEKLVPWRYVNDFEECVNLLRSEGFYICAIEQGVASLPIQDVTKEKDIALVVGREVEGLTTEEINQCDAIFEIPMIGKKESFNVSVAAGIALYQARIA